MPTHLPVFELFNVNLIVTVAAAAAAAVAV
jgi:hypothetical protein